MTNFVTYAQNFEDVMLWRALHGVTDGFYIDVGAADPDEDSVTRAFYDRGWRGINVEPAPTYFAALLAARPRDICLQLLVGEASDEADLHHFDDTGLSTTKSDFAARHIADGREHETVRQPVRTLAEIWKQHAPETVHFLKIDVEGAEAEVLRGADLDHHRPWIILAEATEPGSKTENWSDWNGLLTQSDYRFVWFDGLNRFYIAEERWDALHGAFATPPNVFDLWIQPRGKHQRALIQRGDLAVSTVRQQAEEAAQALNAELGTARTEAARGHAALAELADVRGRLNGAEAKLADLRRQVSAAQADTARAAALDAESSDLRTRLLDQQNGLVDLRRRIIAAEAGRLQATAEVERLRAEHAAAEARRQDDATRWQAEAAQWQAEASQWRAETALWRAESAAWQAEVVHLQAGLDIAWQRGGRGEEALRSISHGMSWRAMAPLRRLMVLTRDLGRTPDDRSAEHGVLSAEAMSEPSIPVSEKAPAPVPPEQDALGGEDDVFEPPEERRMRARLQAWARAE